MKVITVAHQKGGVGKTTLALNLAYCFKDNLKVALLDSDPQGSALGLREVVEGIEFVSYEQVKKRQALPYDIIIIDTPPYLTTTLPEFFEFSDFILVPTKAGVLDAMAIRATITLLKQAQQKRPTLKAGIVLNMIKNRTSFTEDIKEILVKYDTPIFQTQVSDRISYARSPLYGGVFGTEDSKAQDEILNLAGEIIEMLNK